MVARNPRDIVCTPLIEHVRQIRTYKACKEHLYFVTGGILKLNNSVYMSSNLCYYDINERKEYMASVGVEASREVWEVLAEAYIHEQLQKRAEVIDLDYTDFYK